MVIATEELAGGITKLILEGQLDIVGAADCFASSPMKFNMKRRRTATGSISGFWRRQPQPGE